MKIYILFSTKISRYTNFKWCVRQSEILRLGMVKTWPWFHLWQMVHFIWNTRYTPLQTERLWWPCKGALVTDWWVNHPITSMVRHRDLYICISCTRPNMPTDLCHPNIVHLSETWIGSVYRSKDPITVLKLSKERNYVKTKTIHI